MRLLRRLPVLLVSLVLLSQIVLAKPVVVKKEVGIPAGTTLIFFEPKPDEYKVSIPVEYRIVREPLHIKANFTKQGNYKAVFALTYSKPVSGKLIIKQGEVELDVVEFKGEEVLLTVTFKVGAAAGGVVSEKVLAKLLDKRFTAFKNDIMAVNSVLVSVVGVVSAMAFTLVMVVNRLMVRADVKFSELLELKPERKTVEKIGIVGPEARRKLLLLGRQIEALSRPGVNRDLLIKSILENLRGLIESEGDRV